MLTNRVMSNHCCCIAVFAERSQLDEVKRFLLGHGVSHKSMVIISKTNSSIVEFDVEQLLQQSGVPKESRFCYQWVLEVGYCLLVISGSNHLVEQVSAELERFGDVDIAVHLDLT